jgi:hypothetical protein
VLLTHARDKTLGRIGFTILFLLPLFIAYLFDIERQYAM